MWNDIKSGDALEDTNSLIRFSLITFAVIIFYS